MIWLTSTTIPVQVETAQPLELGEQSWRWCRDCASLTSGMCWKHSVRYIVIQQEIK